jgi:hypothetical protein
LIVVTLNPRLGALGWFRHAALSRIFRAGVDTILDDPSGLRDPRPLGDFRCLVRLSRAAAVR